MIYVFDLDDTLYEELTFVKGGYYSVASFLAKEYALNANSLYAEMLNLLSISRDKVFNRLLKNHNQFSNNLIKRCISIYRGHKPNLILYPDAMLFLEKNIGKPMYLVTDGNKLVQNLKVKSLGIKKYFKKVIYTSNYGLKHAKPSPYCFILISKLEKIKPTEITYIGDNPNKDFLKIKKLGFKTIRLMRGMYKDVMVNTNYDAHVKIKGYHELM